MTRAVYHRQSRTPSSEQYLLIENEERLGHLDLHYGASEVFATLVLDRELTEQETADLIEHIDEDLVLSSEVTRDDFLIRVFMGREVGLYSDELLQDEFPADGPTDYLDD